jgi:RNA-directed DNA polymerase
MPLHCRTCRELDGDQHRTDGGTGRSLQSWSSIDWPAVERSVRRLQERIFRASQNGEPAKVKNLQKLLVRSSSAKLLAISPTGRLLTYG